jgi:hypothetical protein
VIEQLLQDERAIAIVSITVFAVMLPNQDHDGDISLLYRYATGAVRYGHVEIRRADSPVLQSSPRVAVKLTSLAPVTEPKPTPTRPNTSRAGEI